jgi:hypothetical protein
MIRAFVYPQSAVLVRHWIEIDPGDGSLEHGARIELRRLDLKPQRGSGSAAQAFVIDKPVWRVDLFDRLDAPPGSYQAAHYHPWFDGHEPSEREFSVDLTANPLGWVRQHLSDIPATYAASKVLLGPGESDDADLIHANVGLITEATAGFLPTQCGSNGQCCTWTADVIPLMQVKMAAVKNPGQVNRSYLAPWLSW